MNNTVKEPKKREIPNLKHASDEMRADSEFVFMAVSADGMQLQYAADELKNDRDIVLEAVEGNGMALQYASRELRSDKNIVYTAVYRNNGLALQFASDELKKHRRIVLTAVKNYGRALEFADDIYKNDKEIVFTAVCNDGNAMEFASVELKKDRDFVLGAVTEKGVTLIYASDEFRNDREIVMAAVFSNGLVFQYIAEGLKYDRGIVLTAVFSNGKALQYAPDDLRYDKDFLIAAVRQNREAYAYVPDEFKNDADILKEVEKHEEDMMPEDAPESEMKEPAAETCAKASEGPDGNMTDDKKETAADGYEQDEVVAGIGELISRRNALLANKVIEGLKSRNMSGYFAASKEEALRIALELIPAGSSVTMGGCMSAHEIGLVKALKSGDYNFIDRDAFEDKRAAMLMAYDADVFLSGANAMTEDGVIINIDGNSNRVSAIAQGPRKVLFIVGMNKVCSDVDGAMKRARNVAAPINAQRFSLSTPCTKTGTCFDCKSPDTICCQFLITRFSRHQGRIHVILVDENLGF